MPSQSVSSGRRRNRNLEYVNMEVPGHFTFNKDGTGEFQFGLVQGEMDCRVETVDGRERIEFSWDG
jgi:hypothetical protein